MSFQSFPFILLSIEAYTQVDFCKTSLDPSGCSENNLNRNDFSMLTNAVSIEIFLHSLNFAQPQLDFIPTSSMNSPSAWPIKILFLKNCTCWGRLWKRTLKREPQNALTCVQYFNEQSMKTTESELGVFHVKKTLNW